MSHLCEGASVELKAAGIRSSGSTVHGKITAGKVGPIRSGLVVGVGVLEIKSAYDLAPIHHQQLLNYMRIEGNGPGLWLNFNVRYCGWLDRKICERDLVRVFRCRVRFVFRFFVFRLRLSLAHSDSARRASWFFTPARVGDRMLEAVSAS